MPLPFPRVLVLLLGLLVWTGCTPQMVHRLDAPDSAEGVWEEGRQVRTARTGGVEAEVSYVRSYAADYALWVRVTNLSVDTVLVDPARFVATGYRSVDAAAARDSTGRATYARDPEAELLNVDLVASRRDARARTYRGLAAASAVVTAAVALADAPDTPEEEAAVANAFLSADVEMEGATYARRVAADVQAEGRAYWESVLRRTTLPPNTYIDGMVHVPVDSEATLVVFEAVADDRRVPFLFVQRSLRP